MLRYVLRRLLYAVPIILGVALLTFLLFYSTSTPEQMAVRGLSAKNPTQDQIQAWIVQHGYDKSKSEQFKKHVGEMFLFRFGKSDITGESIGARIREGALPSALVAGLIFSGSVFAGIVLALVAAYYRGTYMDRLITLTCVLLMSIVSIVYIIVGQYTLSKVLKLFPVAGFADGLEAWKFVMLPFIVGVVSGLGRSVRLYRTFMLEEMNQDYVRTARAKGVGEKSILFKHVLKNAMIPIITSVVLSIPFIFLGNLLVESFFGIPGLGGMMVDAITNQDFAVVRAMVFLGTLLYIVGAILTDVCYALVDPRVRLE